MSDIFTIFTRLSLLVTVIFMTIYLFLDITIEKIVLYMIITHLLHIITDVSIKYLGGDSKYERT